MVHYLPEMQDYCEDARHRGFQRFIKKIVYRTNNMSPSVLTRTLDEHTLLKSVMSEVHQEIFDEKA